LLIQQLSRNRYEAVGDLRELFSRRTCLLSTGSNMGESVRITARLLLAQSMVNIASNTTKLPNGPFCQGRLRFDPLAPVEI
jgi:hypothetical protein